MVWFQEHKDKFVDLTMLKTMFLHRYNPWGKTKQDQLESWNILTFDPQKMDVDEHIDLINTLCDMLWQAEESKRDKFIDTMPTIIQMHLITEKTWEKTTKKVKEKANSLNKNQKTCQHRYKTINTIMGILTIITITRIIEVNPEGIDPIEAKIQVISSEAKIFMAEAKEIKIHTKANIKMTAIKAIITRAIEDFIITHIDISLRVIATAIPEVEAIAEAEAIIMAVVMVGPIVGVMPTINTISIMVMMMSTRQTNMVHHVHYVAAIITLPDIASRESMTSMILWKR